VFAHGFFTIDGAKISKSLGNAIDPLDITAKYGLDTLRFAMLREINFGEDGDFSFTRLNDRYRTELAGQLGNLIYRVLSMAEKYCAGKVPAKSGVTIINYAKFDQALETFAFHDALAVVWGVVGEANRFIDESAPWALAKTGENEKLQKVMYELLETLRHIGRLLLPIMPTTGEGILRQLGVLGTERASTWEAGKTWGLLAEGGTLSKEKPLFPQLETADKA